MGGNIAVKVILPQRSRNIGYQLARSKVYGEAADQFKVSRFDPPVTWDGAPIYRFLLSLGRQKVAGMGSDYQLDCQQCQGSALGLVFWMLVDRQMTNEIGLVLGQKSQWGLGATNDWKRAGRGPLRSCRATSISRCRHCAHSNSGVWKHPAGLSSWCGAHCSQPYLAMT